MKNALLGLSLLTVSLPLFAATPVDLSKPQKSLLANDITTKQISQEVDFNHTTHIRIQQTYEGYPVWGADGVKHVPGKGLAKSVSSNGIMYQNIKQDLAVVPSLAFSQKKQDQVVAHAIELYQKQATQAFNIEDKQATPIIYIDAKNKARWSFLVSFYAKNPEGKMPAKPTFIIDSISLEVLEQWNDIHTLDNVEAGGLGGNHKTGKKIFDGLENHQAVLHMQRNSVNNTCYMQNNDVTLLHNKNSKPVTFPCALTDPNHNNIYWNENFDQVATTWSPSNDVLFGAEVTTNMFKQWYNLPVLSKNGNPMKIVALVHLNDTNAYWDDRSEQVSFGDSPGDSQFNPFTQLDTVAHEIGHGFTSQHSNLQYSGESGGLNEAFSDMAGIAAEYFAYGSTDFLVGLGDVKAEGKSLRYMDKPSKDCKPGQTPGVNCSIDDVSQLKSSTNVHYSSGVFNRVYYVLANTPDWNAKKAFDVMVKANAHYWTSRSTFSQAACGVLKATGDYQYDVNAVRNAFKEVGVKTDACVA